MSDQHLKRSDDAAVKMSTDDGEGFDGDHAIRDDAQVNLKEIEALFAKPEIQLTLGEPAILTMAQKAQRRGLPKPENLIKLAKTWLETTHRLYANLPDSVLPPDTEEAARALASEFESRFVMGECKEYVVDVSSFGWKFLAAAYVRYSCDQSNPLSLDDQLRLEVERAHREGRFIPWCYVFADASVTGRTPLRRGYILAKSAMERFRSSRLDTLYIDGIDRASRASIESYRLARAMERLNKRLIGVSDGFDLRGPESEIMLMALSMFNEMFVKQLRNKVMRGYRGAIERGNGWGKPRFGYKLVQCVDANGKPATHREGRPIRTAAIDEDNMKFVLMAARWFSEDFKSYTWIADRLNEMRAGGRRTWRSSIVVEMLSCPLYIGVRIYNRTKSVLDTETGEIKIERNPRSEWIIRSMPHLKAWPDDLWRKVRRRAAMIREASPCSGRKFYRNKVYPTTLFSGTLVCGNCGRELTLAHSGRNKNMGCPSGFHGVHGCSFRSTKSVRMIEEALLAHIRLQILTPVNLQYVVAKANKYLDEESQKPRVDTAALQRDIESTVREEQELAAFVIKHQRDHDMTVYLRRGDELRKKILSLRKRHREMEALNAEPPPPIQLGDVQKIVTDLRGLLNEGVEKSALMLRALTGPIVIKEHRQAGRYGATWVGHFKSDLVKFMGYASRREKSPDPNTWVSLTSRNWRLPMESKVVLEPLAAQLKLAPALLKVREEGGNLTEAARQCGLSFEKAKRLIHFAQTGLLPKWPHKKTWRRRKPGDPRRPKIYVQISAEVVRLREQEFLSFPEIRKRLKVSLNCIRQAWDHLRPDGVRSGKRGHDVKRGRHTGLGVRRVLRLHSLIREGTPDREVARLIGCDEKTVRNERKRLLAAVARVFLRSLDDGSYEFVRVARSPRVPLGHIEGFRSRDGRIWSRDGRELNISAPSPQAAASAPDPANNRGAV